MKIMVKALKNKPRPGVLLPGVWGGHAYPILADITDKTFGVYIIKDSLCKEKPFLPYQRPTSSGVCLCIVKGPSVTYLSEPSSLASLSFAFVALLAWKAQQPPSPSPWTAFFTASYTRKVKQLLPLECGSNYN